MIAFVTGARPNFIKVKPLIDRCEKMSVEYSVFNSNQHDFNMQVFDVGGGSVHPISHNREGRFSWIMCSFSKFLDEEKPDVVVVVGDTDTSLACGLTADMRNIPVAHVEAGMRSYYKMPEETNRIAIDNLSTYRFTTTKKDLAVLKKEKLDGIFVGNIMIESLLNNWRETVLEDYEYILAEFHRPENDSNMKALLEFASGLEYPVKWVQHPRHESSGVYASYDNIEYLPPQPYQQMITLVANSKMVMTDSGGLQPDSSFLKIPCITFRNDTEWKITLEKGTNVLARSISELELIYKEHMNKSFVHVDFSEDLWDSKVSERIIKTIIGGSQR